MLILFFQVFDFDDSKTSGGEILNFQSIFLTLILAISLALALKWWLFNLVTRPWLTLKLLSKKLHIF